MKKEVLSNKLNFKRNLPRCVAIKKDNEVLCCILTKKKTPFGE
jgi:hypothetical protein